MDTIRWGIMGTGNIAHKFARGLALLPDAEVVSVGSRRQETADAFGDEFSVPHRHASYDALVGDGDVDVVYVSTPHTFHRDNTLLALEAGKHVLCEKPFAINARQARDMVEAARDKGRFLMDAVWSRFLPTHVRAREILASGVLGEIRMVHADFGFRGTVDPRQRLFNPELGGGALLDVGIYDVQLASMVFGEAPTEIAALTSIGSTGVDEQSAMLLEYSGGRMAQLSCAIRTTTHHEASFFGTEGRLRLEAPWWRGTALTVWMRPGPEGGETSHHPYEGNGYQHEAAEVMACLRAGKLESDIMPLDETLSLMETLDAVRAQWGLVYPME